MAASFVPNTLTPSQLLSNKLADENLCAGADESSPQTTYDAGAEVFAVGIYVFVDARDVTKAHILAFKAPLATGRYFLMCTVTYSSKALNILYKLYPSLNLPEK